MKKKTIRIKCAAILHEGRIYEGTSHSEIGLRMIREGVCRPPFPTGQNQGFFTFLGKKAPGFSHGEDVNHRHS